MSNNTTELNLLNTTESELATKTNPLSTIIFGLTIEYDDIESDELKWDTTINQIASEPITDYNYTLEELSTFLYSGSGETLLHQITAK